MIKLLLLVFKRNSNLFLKYFISKLHVLWCYKCMHRIKSLHLKFLTNHVYKLSKQARCIGFQWQQHFSLAHNILKLQQHHDFWRADKTAVDQQHADQRGTVHIMQQQMCSSGNADNKSDSNAADYAMMYNCSSL